MKIAAGSLCLAVAVFLDSIELMTSNALTLAQLFSGNNGVMPPIEVFEYRPDARIEHIYKYGFLTMHNPPTNDFLARGHFIVAWRRVDNVNHRGDYIEPLWKLFLPEFQLIAVFDTIQDEWVFLPINEFDQLGFGRVFQLAHARDQVAATTKQTTDRPEVDHQANLFAYKEANRQMDILEAKQVKELRRGHTTPEASSELIRQKYTLVYIRAFNRYMSDQGSNYHPH